MEKQQFIPDEDDNKSLEDFIQWVEEGGQYLNMSSDDLSGWTEERYISHIKELQQHIQDLYDKQV
jgi:hypothetical protein